MTRKMGPREFGSCLSYGGGGGGLSQLSVSERGSTVLLSIMLFRNNMTSDNVNLIFYVSVSKVKKIRFFLNTRDPEILNDKI